MSQIDPPFAAEAPHVWTLADFANSGIVPGDLAIAVVTWATAKRGRPLLVKHGGGIMVSVAEAAKSFCTTGAVIERALDGHAWMVIIGPDGDYEHRFISLDGE